MREHILPTLVFTLGTICFSMQEDPNASFRSFQVIIENILQVLVESNDIEGGNHE